MDRRGRTVLLVAAIALAACAHDLPGWKRVSTDHFRLYTELAPHTYEAVLERLEDVHLGLTSLFFQSTATAPMEVFLFSEPEFHQLAGNWGGMFVGRRGEDGALAIYDGYDPHLVEATAAHELSHGFITATYPSVPIWFNEGFASYLESIIVERDRVWFGSINVNAGVAAGRGRLIPVSALFAAPWRVFHGDGEDSHYATGWALVHYVLHGESRTLRARFDRFGAALARVGSDPGGGGQAWHEVFPEIPLDELDGRVRAHVDTLFGRHVDSRMGVRLQRPPGSPLRVDPADPARVDAMRTALRRAHKHDDL
jgi:hypothetical protein